MSRSWPSPWPPPPASGRARRAPSSPGSIDHFPPARDLTRRRNKYFIGTLDPCASVEFTRGCPWDCSFCSAWTFYGRSYRRASPEAAAAEVASIREPGVFIVDDVAFIKPEHGHAIAAELEKRRVRKKYYLETRSDVLLRNEEVFRRWRRLGLDYMFLGMEAMDEGGLEAYRKRVRSTTAQNLTTLDYRLFDIQHAVPPTTLPLPVFYAELVKTQAVINRKHLGVAGLAQTAGIATRLLLRGQTNFVHMLWRFSSVYNGDRQLADHQRPIRYELPPPSPDAITPGRRELYVHEIRGRGDCAGAIVPAPSDPA